MRRGLRVIGCGALFQLATAAAHAEPPAWRPSPAEAPAKRSPRVQARSETYLQLFQRALLPGPNGAIVETRTELPLHEYVSVRASGVAPPWRLGSLDAEVSAWGALLVWGNETPQRVDGDITTAFVQQRLGPGYVRLGRQSASSAAARYVRFDGIKAGAELSPALGLDAYAGWTVLPRWDARPGYQHLGSIADSLVRDPEAVDRLDRSGWRVAGGRIHVSHDGDLAAGLSFHDEQQTGELARRNLGLDLRLSLDSAWSVSATSTLDTDSWQLADARLWVDVFPAAGWSVTAEYLRTTPALFLSHQSVLSVFSTSAYDECGAALSYRPWRHVSLLASAYAQLMDEELGVRSEGKLRATLDQAERLRFQVAHTRMLGADNGYHALRTSLGYIISARLQSNAELYYYRYDEPIRGHRHSLVQAGNVSFKAAEALSLLWGVSLVSSPYARSDLQTLVRLTHDIDGW